MPRKINWIPERLAADRLGYAPRTLRKLVLAGTLNVSYTTIRGRKYHYDEQEIERVFMANAVYSINF